MADWISSAIGAVGNIFDSGLSIAASAKAAKRQYEYQRLLNQQAYDLTQQGYRESYGNMRIGLENAGYNPILAVNSNPYTGYSGGSATGMQPNINSDISGKSSNAYRAFKLEKEKQEAEIDLLRSQQKNIDEDTKLKKYDKPLKVIGDLIEKPTNAKKVVKDVYGEIVTPHVHTAKEKASKGFWSYYDLINDIASYSKDRIKGNDIPFKYYKGLSKSSRINKGIYNYKQLKYKPHVN